MPDIDMVTDKFPSGGVKARYIKAYLKLCMMLSAECRLRYMTNQSLLSKSRSFCADVMHLHKKASSKVKGFNEQQKVATAKNHEERQNDPNDYQWHDEKMKQVDNLSIACY